MVMTGGLVLIVFRRFQILLVGGFIPPISLWFIGVLNRKYTLIDTNSDYINMNFH